MNRYILFFIFSVLIVFAIIFNISSKISSKLLSTLPTSQNKELLNTFLKMKLNKKLFVAVKGEDKEALETLRSIEQQLLQIQGLKKEQFSQNKKLQEYQKEYRLYLNSLDTKKLDSLDPKKELERLYQSITSSFFIVSIDQNDPFNLLEKKEQKLNIKNGRLFLSEYGYLSILSLNSEINSLNEYERIYDEVKQIEQNYQEVISFSPIYYFVENSRYIKKDATTIGILAIVLLLVLYFIILQNISLLFNTLLTLGASALFAMIVVSFLYGEISIFVLVFGVSISTIAIDYMFHHYFHKHYQEQKGFNKEVFLGFLTTSGVFFILSFSGFILIQQIAVFALISLLFSYLIFSFIFPRLGFQQKAISLNLQKMQVVKGKYIFIFSIGIIIFSLLNLRFDLDISSLNYENKELQQKELLFQKGIVNSDKYTVILKASSIEELIKYNEMIRSLDMDLQSPLNSIMSQSYFEKRKQELKNLALEELYTELHKYSKELGFKKDSFIEAYKYDLKFLKFNYQMLREYGINIEKYKEDYITFIQVSKDKYEEILAFDFVYSTSIKKLFEKSLQEELDKLILLGMLSLAFIIGIMIVIAKKHSLEALSFLLFPSGLILLYTNFIEVNILHLFMFFVILAISIDYGIYSVKNKNSDTQKAILFSALSSFAGFGVLIFSSTNSLFSIGSVATLGIIGILILVFLRKDDAVKSL